VSGPARPRLTAVYAPLPGENAGLYELHVGSLQLLLEPLGWSVDPRSVLDPGLAEAVLGADVVVLGMLTDPEAEGIIRCRRARGLPTVYEITDNVLGADWLPPTHALRSPLARQSLLYHAHLADALQMLVPALADLFAAVNPRRIVLSPYLPFPDDVPPKPDGFVFGWAGSRTHYESLAASAPAVVELCRRHPEATFAYMGDRAMFDELFAAIAPGQTRVHPFGTQDEHLAFTAGLHAGIAPMRPTPFNATRSDTRVVVYAGHGVAPVLEDAPAHRPHRGRALIYHDADELLEHLEALFADRALVADLARRAREWADRERSPSALGAERDRAYRALLADVEERPGAGAAPGEAEAVAVWAADGAASEAPPPSAPELCERLALARERPPEEALALALALAAEHPGYEQAHLLAARSLERLGRHDEVLAYVERVEPSPVYADLFAEIAARAAARVRPAEREAHVARIGSPFRRARMAPAGSPRERGRAVLEHQPYDHFALASTIRLLEREDPDSPELEVLYERACMLAPEDVPEERRPPRLRPFLPEPLTAAARTGPRA
jgi:hypothetical protein